MIRFAVALAVAFAFLLALFLPAELTSSSHVAHEKTSSPDPSFSVSNKRFLLQIIACPGGYYLKEPFDDHCTAAGRAYYSPHGSLDRHPCLPGTIGGESETKTTQTECEPCPFGHQNPNFASLTCEYCPTGSWTMYTGTAQCEYCNPFYYDGLGSDYALYLDPDNNAAPYADIYCFPPAVPIEAPTGGPAATTIPTFALQLEPTPAPAPVSAQPTTTALTAPPLVQEPTMAPSIGPNGSQQPTWSMSSNGNSPATTSISNAPNVSPTLAPTTSVTNDDDNNDENLGNNNKLGNDDKDKTLLLPLLLVGILVLLWLLLLLCFCYRKSLYEWLTDRKNKRKMTRHHKSLSSSSISTIAMGTIHSATVSGNAHGDDKRGHGSTNKNTKTSDKTSLNWWKNRPVPPPPSLRSDFDYDEEEFPECWPAADDDNFSVSAKDPLNTHNNLHALVQATGTKTVVNPDVRFVDERNNNNIIDDETVGDPLPRDKHDKDNGDNDDYSLDDTHTYVARDDSSIMPSLAGMASVAAPSGVWSVAVADDCATRASTLGLAHPDPSSSDEEGDTVPQEQGHGASTEPSTASLANFLSLPLPHDEMEHGNAAQRRNEIIFDDVDL